MMPNSASHVTPSLMNPCIGNISWEEGVNVSHLTPRQHVDHEKQRVRRHLEYVHHMLLNNTKSNDTARQHHIQQLKKYIIQQSFPLHVDTREPLNRGDYMTCGRAPVFVDDKQRLCAVAHLITFTPQQYIHHPTCTQSSTGPQPSCSNPRCAPSSELVSYIAKHWRYGYIMDIVTELLSNKRSKGWKETNETEAGRYATLFLVWLASCGLSVSELAILQPTYDWLKEVDPERAAEEEQLEQERIKQQQQWEQEQQEVDEDMEQATWYIQPEPEQQLEEADTSQRETSQAPCEPQHEVHQVMSQPELEIPITPSQHISQHGHGESTPSLPAHSNEEPQAYLSSMSVLGVMILLLCSFRTCYRRMKPVKHE